MERILRREHADAYTNTFQDLWGMEELPGIASQHLMSRGYGYGAEGDWKTGAMDSYYQSHDAGSQRREFFHGGLHLPLRKGQ